MLYCSVLIHSPYAQPREQTYMQRMDITQSDAILEEDLLTMGKEAHTASAFRSKMGYRPKGGSHASHDSCDDRTVSTA